MKVKTIEAVKEFEQSGVQLLMQESFMPSAASSYFNTGVKNFC